MFEDPIYISIKSNFLYFFSPCIFHRNNIVIATVALAFLLLPMCQYIIRPCSDGNRISFGVCGRFSAAELFSFSLSLSIVCIWVLTGHWLLMDGEFWQQYSIGLFPCANNYRKKWFSQEHWHVLAMYCARMHFLPKIGMSCRVIWPHRKTNISYFTLFALHNSI